MHKTEKPQIVTAGTSDFRKYISLTQHKAQKLGYPCRVFDLHDLGFGEPYPIHDRTFLEEGMYPRIEGTSKRSRALHKPRLIQKGMSDQNTIYLDGDTVLHRPVHEVFEQDFDVAVTIRTDWEIHQISKQTDMFKMLALGYCNAGVVFLKYNTRTISFIRDWITLTTEKGNDQYALNYLVAPWESGCPTLGKIVAIEGLRILYLPSLVYNNCYPPKGWLYRWYSINKTSIYHFRKGRARRNFLLYAKSLSR